MELPEVDEFVIAIIKKIMPYGAFCILPEYNNIEAFLHISEVAPRWIKNIHEFISEGERHVVKVCRVDKEKGQVDISLKRVSEEEKRRKLELIKIEKRATKLLQLAMENVKTTMKPEEVRQVLEEKFDFLYDVFEEAVERGEEALKDVNLPNELKARIVEIAQKNIKRRVVELKGIIMLSCYGDNGIERIKDVLNISDEDVNINYLGAPRYQIVLRAPDYKTAEKRLSGVLERIKKVSEKHNCTFAFEKKA